MWGDPDHIMRDLDQTDHANAVSYSNATDTGFTHQTEIPVFYQSYPIFTRKIDIFKGNHEMFENDLIYLENKGISV